LPSIKKDFVVCSENRLLAVDIGNLSRWRPPIERREPQARLALAVPRRNNDLAPIRRNVVGHVVSNRRYPGQERLSAPGLQVGDPQFGRV